MLRWGYSSDLTKRIWCRWFRLRRVLEFPLQAQPSGRNMWMFQDCSGFMPCLVCLGFSSTKEMIERFSNTARKMKHAGSGGRKQSHVRKSVSACLPNGTETSDNTTIRLGRYACKSAVQAVKAYNLSSVYLVEHINGGVYPIQRHEVSSLVP